MILLITSLIIINVITGLISGFFGVGGGIILVPCLSLLLSQLADYQLYHMQIAVATSMLCSWFLSISTVVQNMRQRLVPHTAFFKLAPAVMIGALLGPSIALMIPSTMVQWVFSGALLGATYLNAPWQSKRQHRCLPLLCAHDRITSFLIALITSMIGIGCGIFMLPYLFAAGYEHRQASALTISMTFLLYTISSITYLFQVHDALVGPLLLGPVFYPAILTTVIIAPLLSHVGIALSNRTDRHRKQGLLFMSIIFFNGLNLLEIFTE